MNQNKKIVMILSTVFTIVLALSFTYAFFYYGKEGNTIKLETGNIQINFSENSNYLTLKNTFPKSDNAGKISVDYYDFTVSGSNGKYDNILYQVQLEQVAGNTLREEFINVYLTDQNDTLVSDVKTLNTLPVSAYNSNRVIYTGYITGANQADDYRLRVWVNDGYTDNVENTFKFKVVLYAVNTSKTTD